MLFFNRRDITAVDIGSYAIKVVNMQRTRGGVKLNAAGTVRIEPDAMRRGEIFDTAQVSKSLDKLLSAMGLNVKKAVTTISNQNLIIRDLKLPLMSEDEVGEALKWEAADYLPFSVESSVLDYSVTGYDSKDMEILLVAAKKRVVDSFLAPLQELNIKPVAVLVQPLVLLALAGHQKELIEPVMIIDIGNTNSRIVIGDQRKIYLFRNVNVGGTDFTDALVNGFGLDFNEAEEEKKAAEIGEDVESYAELNRFSQGALNNFRVGPGNLNLSEPNNSGKEQHVQSLLMEPAQKLSSEISRSLEYFEVRNRGRGINTCYLTGGGSKLKGLKGLFEKQTGQQFKLLDPFAGINTDSATWICPDASIRAEEATEFSVAIGLAISKL